MPKTTSLREAIATAMTATWSREATVCEHTQRIPLGLLADAAVTAVEQQAVSLEERGLALVDSEDLAKADELREQLLALRAKWETRRTRVADMRKAIDRQVNRLAAGIEHDVYARVLRELDAVLGTGEGR